MKPKGKLFALFAIFAAIGLVTATGAFTTVSADRTMTATTAGDSSALLGLAPHSGPNGIGPSGSGGSETSSEGYAQIDSDTGTLVINLGGYDSGNAQSQGLNYNAKTVYNNVFNITNNGEQDVNVNVTAAGGQTPTAIHFYEGAGISSGSNVTGPDHTTTLTPGETMSVTIEVDLKGLDRSTFGSDGADIADTIVITARSS